MEATRKSSLRRKPLSDLTNIVAATTRRNPPSAAPKSAAAAIVKPPKPSDSSVTTTADKPKPATTSSSLKSHTSTGSNASPNAPSVPSHPPAPPTPLSDSDGRDRRKSGSLAAQSQRQDAKTRNDKGKMVSETPTIQLAKPLIHQTLQVSLSAASGNCHPSRPPALQSQEPNAQTRKDKGKMVLETPIIRSTKPLTHQTLHISSSAASGYCHPSRPPALQNQEPNVQTRKDKGKMVVETPIILITKPLARQTLHLSSSAASGNCYLSRPPALQNQEPNVQTRKDKGKMVLETPVIQITKPLTRQTLHLSSSAASGNCYLSRPPVLQSQAPDAQTRKDKGKMILETPNIEADPMTPHPDFPISSSSASGTREQERPDFLTVYNQRRSPRRRKHGDGTTVLPFSCPPHKRMKKKGVEFDNDASDKHSGSHTDPLPVHKKKRSRNKNDGSMHAMPQDEIEKLKSYYADIDAFELPEEVASESDLE